MTYGRRFQKANRIKILFIPFPISKGKPGIIVMLLEIGVWLFLGFRHMCLPSEEIKKLEQTLPLVMAVVLVIALVNRIIFGLRVIRYVPLEY